MNENEAGNGSQNSDLGLVESQDDSTRIVSTRVNKGATAGGLSNGDPNIDPTIIEQSKSNHLGETPVRRDLSEKSADKTQLVKRKVKQKSTADNSDKTRIERRRAKANPSSLKKEEESDSNVDRTRFQKPSRNAAEKTIIDRSRVKHSADDVSDKQSINDSEPLLKKRFVLEKVLGAGGMGVVYKARDLVKVEAGDKDPYVAIKVLTEEFKEHPEAFVALQRESRKTQRIAHPNIVNVHDFDKDKGTVFMTMEFLEGKPLDQLIRQYQSTGLPSDEALKIIESVCQALSYAHGQKIIHSDFKPGNIFVTNSGVTKVFDFGIARAVAKAEQYEDNPEDRTIFDAGDLGALTPAYASFEMLNGQEPDIRDDIYALGCVAYELFTGKHPFEKIPADEAKKQKLKPKKISGISRRQWKAIQKSLSFERENRIASADEFLSMMTEQSNPYKWPLMFLLAAFLGVAGYMQFNGAPENLVDETEIRSELEFKLRIENYRNQIDNLVKERSFTASWESELWINYQGMQKILDKDSKMLINFQNSEFLKSIDNDREWFSNTTNVIYQAYLSQSSKLAEEDKLEKALELLANAKRYTQTHNDIDDLIASINQKVEAKKAKAIAEEEARKLAEAQRRIADKKADDNKKAQRLKEKESQEFQSALKNVNGQLACSSSRLDMRNLATAIEKLQAVNLKKYQAIQPQIIEQLANCISSIGKQYPQRAEEFKANALRIFDNHARIVAINIVPRDPCAQSLAGLGARGKRAICKDTIKGAGTGPELVVIPAGKGNQLFAIGKYEVSNQDFNIFCSSTNSCSGLSTRDPNLPVANVNIKTIERYLAWLSEKTGKVYRLPSRKEWEYAARSTRIKLDSNRNCKLNTRGISKGDSFVRATVGSQNAWGLVNYVGNASELVFDQGRRLMALGGAYNIAMDNCNISTASEHSGEADPVTGFRVLREIKVNGS